MFWDETGRDGTQKNDFLSWLAPYLRLKENTASNLPNTNAAEINPNDEGITEAEDNFSDCSEKRLFSRKTKF